MNIMNLPSKKHTQERIWPDFKSMQDVWSRLIVYAVGLMAIGLIDRLFSNITTRQKLMGRGFLPVSFVRVADEVCGMREGAG